MCINFPIHIKYQVKEVLLFIQMFLDTKTMEKSVPGAMYPIEPHNIFAVEFPISAAAPFPPPAVITNLAIPKSETRAVISSLRRTLLGFRSQCMTLTGE